MALTVTVVVPVPLLSTKMPVPGRAAGGAVGGDREIAGRGCVADLRENAAAARENKAGCNGEIAGCSVTVAEIPAPVRR